MRHSTLNDMFEEMLDDRNDLIITANSKQCALCRTNDGVYILKGDFSGSPEECEIEARRILNQK